MIEPLKTFSSYKHGDMRDAFYAEFRRLDSSYGREKATQGIQAAIRSHTEFHPPVTALEDFVKLSPGLVKWGSPKQGCTDCDGMGWRESKEKPGYVERCECRRIA